MNRTIQCAVLVLALLFLTGCCKEDGHALSVDDQATLSAMFENGMTHLKAGDHNTWATGFTGDGILQRPNGPTVNGTAELEAWGRSLPVIESMSWDNLEIRGEGNLAWATSDYATTFVGMPEDRGKQLVVFQRNEAGEWKVAAVSFNSDLPLQQPEMPVEE